eukprot:COSAG06_NODE_2935_length_6066_cov_74.847495_10_plen_37_part_01
MYLLLSFPYVCPEPVLVRKMISFSIKWRKRCVSYLRL